MANYMNPLKKYKSTLSFRIDHPKEVIFQNLIRKVEDYSLTGDTIQIRIKPTSFDVSSGRGFINISVRSTDTEKCSILETEVFPTSFTREGLCVLGSILLAWTSIALLISFSFYSLLTILAGWAIMAIVAHLTQRLNQGKLENYVAQLIAGLVTRE